MTLRGQYLALAGALAAGEAAGLLGAGVLAAFWPAALLACALTLLFGYGFAWRGWGYAATALLGLALSLSAESVRLDTLRAAEHTSAPFSAVVRAESVSGRALDGSYRNVRLRIILPPDVRAEVGDRWRVTGWLQRTDRSDRRPRKVWITGRKTSAERLPADGTGRLIHLFDTIRRDLSRRVGLGLDHAPDIADLNRAILLGERRRLPPDLKRAFQDAGTLHLFAISGLHIGAVALTLAFLLALVGVPFRWTGLAVLPCLWGYTLVIGAPASAVRAAAMASLYFAAPLFWRRSDALAAWSLVFLAVHLVHPLQLADAGSLLSFSVMLALIAWGQFFRRGFTLAAWAAGTPIAARVFGRFTLGGLLANLLLLPLAGLTVALGIVGLAASFASATLAGYVNNASALLTRLMVALSGAVADLPGAAFETEPWSLVQCLEWYALAVLMPLLCLLVRNRRRRSLA